MPVFYYYPGTSNPQPAFVRLKDYGAVDAVSSSCDDWDTQRKCTLQWPIDARLAGAQIANAVQTALSLIERIHAGHSVGQIGNDFVGALTEDASEAAEQLRQILGKIQPTGNDL